MTKQHDSIRPIRWQNHQLHLIDQRVLPATESWLHYDNVYAVADAIRDMVVRGAPAIGITAAYAIVLAATERYAQDPQNWKSQIESDLQRLAESRPTAVNLFWAINRMRQCIAQCQADPRTALLAEAQAIQDEDVQANYKMGELGASLLNAQSRVITHCNAGALATGGYGTALGVIRAAFEQNKLEMVYADETRPWLQGARLTSWELQQEGIPVTLIAEGAAAMLMRQEKPEWVIVGSDRIVANGDVANKIGTYSLAVNARRHGVKVMVAAPTSTIDMDIASGDAIPIEYRSEQELLTVAGHPLAPQNVRAWNPVFDVTPAELVDAIVTEKGIVEQPNRTKIEHMLAS